MASSPDTAAARSAAPDTPAERSEGPKGHVVKAGHLPVSEFLFDKAGAGSPYGDEVEFPLPTDKLPYRHPQTATPRDH
ncbi:MAG TPA: hypothetical protein VFZ32_07560 [Micromonosporaceae bacterium]|jgi:succinate dehydrogenase / fumarate reductase iron-sulfur subunit